MNPQTSEPIATIDAAALAANPTILARAAEGAWFIIRGTDGSQAAIVSLDDLDFLRATDAELDRRDAAELRGAKTPERRDVR
jgi:hypothetical protein